MNVAIARRADEAQAVDAAYRIVMLRANWETQSKLRDWAQGAGFDLSWSFNGWPQNSSSFDFHVTLVASSNKVSIPDGCTWLDDITLTATGYALLGPNKDVPVISIEADKKLTAMRDFFIEAYGVKPTYPDFKPHISLSYKWDGQPPLNEYAPALPDFPLVFDLLMVSIMDPPSTTNDARSVRKIMTHADKAMLEGTRKTKDGYLISNARVARGDNIQDYLGSEIGEAEPGKVYKIWRPADEIFKTDSLSTFAHKPVTLGHPASGVSPENFQDEGVGHLGSEVIRDGEYVRVPLVVMDAKAISAVESGDAREISMGYDCELVMDAGTTPDGRAYDGYQKNIRINHCAIVPAGRAGPQCRIGDQSRSIQQQKGKPAMKTVTVDGKTFEVADEVAAAILADQAKAKQTNDTLADAAKVLGEAKNALAAQKQATEDEKKKAEDAAKAVPTADQIQAAAAEMADTIAKASKIAPSLDTKGKSTAEIKQAAVASVLGDAAVKGKDAAYFDAAFDMLSKPSGDPVADAIAKADGSNTQDADTKRKSAYDEYVKGLQTAHKAAA